MICSVAVDKISAELERRAASYYRTELLVCFCCFRFNFFSTEPEDWLERCLCIDIFYVEWDVTFYSLSVCKYFVLSFLPCDAKRPLY